MAVVLRVHDPRLSRTLDIFYTRADVDNARAHWNRELSGSVPDPVSGRRSTRRCDISSQGWRVMLAAAARAAIASFGPEGELPEERATALHEAALGFSLSVEQATGDAPHVIDVHVLRDDGARISWCADGWVGFRTGGGT